MSKLLNKQLYRVVFRLLMFVVISGPVPSLAGVQLVPVTPTEISIFPEHSIVLAVALQTDQSTGSNQAACNLRWSSSPQVTLPTAASTRLMLAPKSLQAGTDYIFRVDAVCADSTAFTEFKVHVLAHPAPYGGSCNVSPGRGYADGVTAFNVSTEGWKEAVKTGIYIIKPDGTVQPIVPMQAGSSKLLVTKFDYQGEQPIRLECRAENIAGLSAKAQTFVTVLPAGGQPGASSNQLTVLCNPLKLSKNQTLRLFAAVKSTSGAAVNQDSLSYRWDISPAVPVSLPQSPMITLPQQQMQQFKAGQRYTFTARVKEGSASELTAACTVNLLAPPSGGNCVAAWQVHNGQPLHLRVSTANWQIDQEAQPLTYQFFYEMPGRQKVALGQRQASQTAIFPTDPAIMQHGGKIICVAYTAQGDYGQVSTAAAPAPLIRLNPPAPARTMPSLRR